MGEESSATRARDQRWSELELHNRAVGVACSSERESSSSFPLNRQTRRITPRFRANLRWAPDPYDALDCARLVLSGRSLSRTALSAAAKIHTSITGRAGPIIPKIAALISISRASLGLRCHLPSTRRAAAPPKRQHFPRVQTGWAALYDSYNPPIGAAR